MMSVISVHMIVTVKSEDFVSISQKSSL